jgi:TPR repeat protein
MASSSSHNNDVIVLSTQVEWYKIRDTFLGRNFVSQDISLALELVSSCQHPDALWLTNACAKIGAVSKLGARLLFSALGENDARAVCFKWLLDEREDFTPLRRPAELDFAFAQALMAGETSEEERFKFAQLSAAQGERDGFYWLGICFDRGEGCVKDLDKAKQNFLSAINLGHCWSLVKLGQMHDESDPQRWRLLGRAAGQGAWRGFLSSFAKQVESFNSGAGNAAVMLAIGKSLCGHVEKRTIFNCGRSFESLVGPAKQAIAFYDSQIKATKDAMHAWTQVGIKLNVVKDVRKLIAKLIWDSREEALYKT